MNPMFVTFLGFVVAMLIILWAVVLLVQRYVRHKKADTQARNAWVMLKPTPTQVVDVARDEDVKSPSNTDDLHNRAKQNGHFSQTKPTK